MARLHEDVQIMDSGAISRSEDPIGAILSRLPFHPENKEILHKDIRWCVDSFKGVFENRIHLAAAFDRMPGAEQLYFIDEVKAGQEAAARNGTVFDDTPYVKDRDEDGDPIYDHYPHKVCNIERFLEDKYTSMNFALPLLMDKAGLKPKEAVVVGKAYQDEIVPKIHQLAADPEKFIHGCIERAPAGFADIRDVVSVLRDEKLPPSLAPDIAAQKHLRRLER